MAIGDGKYIAIEFDRPLVGDVSGLTPTPFGGYEDKQINIGGATVTSLNQYSTTYSKEKAIDGSTSTYWRGTTAINWIALQLTEAKAVTKFRLYMGSYYIASFTISGSVDGSNWTQIGDTLTGASSTTKRWYKYEIENTTAYLYYRIDTLTAYQSSRIYLYEIEFFETVPIGNESTFTVTGQEYDYVPGGTLGAVTYPVKSVSALSPTVIALEFVGGSSSIRSSVGDITVAYSGAGNLAGEGGPVERFSVSFTPADLVAKPHQNDQEHLEIVDATYISTLTRIYYSDAQAGGENLEIADVAYTSTLTHVDDI